MHFREQSMVANAKYFKIGVVVLAWVGVLLAATYRSHTPMVFDRYSLGYAGLLSLLVGVAATLSLAKSAWYLKLYQVRAGIVISGVSLLLAISAVELVIRAVDLFGISYYALLGEYTRDKLADEDLVFRHKASWEKRYGDVLVTYNERGLRDRPILPKVKGEYRILALGDSVTFGWGVDQDKTFAARLEPLLQGHLHRPVRVINSGVGGYNTVQEVTYFKWEGITLQPDMVMLTYVTNDIEENKGPFNPWTESALHGKSLPDMVISMVGNLWFFRLAHHSYHYGWYKQLKEESLNHLQGRRGWRQSMSSLNELVTICKEHSMPLVVFFKRWNTSEYQSLFEDVDWNTPDHPINDMGQWFEGLDITTLVNSKVDGHINADGHRVVAEHMADEIVNYLATRNDQGVVSGQVRVAIVGR
jgi:lysophospholipase L1-like esterase